MIRRIKIAALAGAVVFILVGWWGHEQPDAAPIEAGHITYRR